jgi:hypothetical protein
LASKEKAYASAGNEQGERAMAQAAENVRDIKGAAYATTAVVAQSASASAMPEEIEESIDELEDNLAEAERCCDLPPDFLDSNLRSFRTQAASIEPLVDQIESERPTAQPESERSTAQPNAQPTDQYTPPP